MGGRERTVGRTRPGVGGTIAVLVLAFVAGACEPVPTVTFNGDDTFQTTVLTPDGYDAYGFVAQGAAMSVAALDPNTGGNLRDVFWPTNGPPVPDSMTCATWTGQNGDLVQQGAALRIRTEPGRVRAVTVTKNIFYGATWIFNFHTWDTNRSRAFEQFGQVTLDAMKNRPLPWRFCTRLIGSRMDFKVWPSGVAEPAWGSNTYGASDTLPSGWTSPGKAGWYIGHIPPDGSARFDQLGAWAYNYAPAAGRSEPVTTPAPENVVIVPQDQ